MDRSARPPWQSGRNSEHKVTKGLVNARLERRCRHFVRPPYQSKFVDAITWRLATFGRDLVVFMVDERGENRVCF